MEELIISSIVVAIRTARRSGMLSGKTDKELADIEVKLDNLITDTNNRVLKKLDLIK